MTLATSMFGITVALALGGCGDPTSTSSTARRDGATTSPVGADGAVTDRQDAGIDDAGALDAGTADAGALGPDAGPGEPWTDPFPVEWIEIEDLLETGFGRVRFRARDGNELDAYLYRATGFRPVDSPILFVMHGVGRTAESYLRAAAPIAERRDALAIAILFDEARYPSSESYNLGVGVGDTPEGPDYVSDAWRPASDYTYAELEHVFEATRRRLGGLQRGYYVLGHSAGAQFTHRLLTFLSPNRVIRAVAANAGWYTMPTQTAEPRFFMPYGLAGAPPGIEVEDILASDLTILVGEEDVGSEDLRTTPEAMAQGDTRLARARHYHSFAEGAAASAASAFGFRIGEVRLAGHDKDEMFPSADFYLFEEDRTPCEPTRAALAAGLVINEINADPEPGVGDANGDGLVEEETDEFLELVNTGRAPLCLSGWSIGDARDEHRHVFPIGSRLAPGAAMVVFGGGVPTGDFGGTRVQWAAFGGALGLTDTGDVISVADHLGTLALRVSWGDCAGSVCAEEHLPGALSLRRSVTRYPDVEGAFASHPDLAGVGISPGVRVDGERF